MSLENWKLEKDLCRCCHSEGCFKNLAEPSVTPDVAEVYADMLKECYDIDMAPVPGLLSAATYTICDVCVIRLRDASDFKKQVVVCEARFKDMYNKNGIKAAVTTIEVEVKQEIPDSEPDEDFKEELSVAEDDNGDEDNDESMDLKINEEAVEKPVTEEVRKKRKYKTRKTVKSKTTKRTKRKNMKQEPDEENDAEKKQGDSRVEAPKSYLKKDEDYKKVGEIYHCARCNKTYDKVESLRQHVKLKHYKIPRYKCSVCSEAFMTVPPLTVHKLEAHKIDDRVTCSVCNKMFNVKVQLTKHIKNVHMLGEVGERYKCEFCDYETFKSVAMYKHKFKHKTVKDFHCTFCNKSFKRKTTLKLHERIHTGDRRNVCNLCGEAFVQKASLNYHMTKYHPEVNF